MQSVDLNCSIQLALCERCKFCYEFVGGYRMRIHLGQVHQYLRPSCQNELGYRHYKTGFHQIRFIKLPGSQFLPFDQIHRCNRSTFLRKALAMHGSLFTPGDSTKLPQAFPEVYRLREVCVPATIVRTCFDKNTVWVHYKAPAVTPQVLFRFLVHQFWL